MKTEIINLRIEDKSLAYKKAGEVIRNGGLVAFPTETVYGLGASAYDEKAIDKIFMAKGRPSDNPLIVHICQKEQIEQIAYVQTEDAKKLIDAFMPGPLTVVLKKKDKVAKNVSKNLDTVAIRMPSNKEARDFIKEAKVPIAAPSANTSGRPSATKAKYVIEDFDGKIDMILASDPSLIGVESTVIDVSTNKTTLLRPGGVLLEDIEKVLEKKVLFANDEDFNKPKSPGMKYAHYQPKGKVTLLSGSNTEVVTFIRDNIVLNNQTKVGVLAYKEVLDELENSYGIKIDKGISLGKTGDEKSATKILFDALRTFDDEDIKDIYVQGTDEEGLGLAYMNRAIKAAGGNHIIM